MYSVLLLAVNENVFSAKFRFRQTFICSCFQDFEKKFQATINGIPEEDLTVFADLMGGTPANTVSRLIMSGQNIHLIAGMNLVMVIDWLNSQMIGNGADSVNAGKAGIVDINQMLASMKK